MRQTDENVMDDSMKLDVITMIQDFFRVLRRMLRHVVLLAVIGGVLLGWNAERNYTAYYTASATFTISVREEQVLDVGSNSAYYDAAAAEQLATTFPYILTSDVLRRKVANELGLGYVPGNVTADVAENTNLMTLSVRDTDPSRAYETLQAVMNHYPSVSEVIVGKVTMKVLDETGVPSQPDNPKNILSSVLKGILYGAGAGVLWALLVCIFRRSIRREEDCHKYIHQRCLGAIPFVHTKERSVKTAGGLNVLDINIHNDFKESVRLIRNKLARYARENSCKTILVTSALAGEGKSTVAVNLAISLAQEGKKVALIDCDLRNPSDGEILNFKSDVGLIDYLLNKVSFKECIFTAGDLGIEEKIPLLFIPAGKAIADGANLLSKGNMEQVIESLKDKMDYVILDSAPVGLLTDAGVLAQYADGGVFVIKKDFAKVDHILNAIKHLAESKIHMLGCVLNGE